MAKICTDLNQSKKLKELGINVNTADMLWTYDFVVNDINGLNVISDNFKPEEKDIPAWSLAALLGVIPDVSLNSFKDGGYWNVMVQHDGKMIYVDKDNPVDACYGLIIKLKELKLL